MSLGGGADPRQAHEDGALAAQVGEGSAWALETLYGRYSRPCYALARRILVDEQLAQDVVQEVFLALWRDAGRFDATRGGFSSWLLSMTHHKAVDAVRREENRRRRRGPIEEAERAPDTGPEVADEVWQTLRAEQVRRALADLPTAQRDALNLAYFGGYTQREIAGLTGTPLGTVKTRMMAGMHRLRDRLAELPVEGEEA